MFNRAMFLSPFLTPFSILKSHHFIYLKKWPVIGILVICLKRTSYKSHVNEDVFSVNLRSLKIAEKSAKIELIRENSVLERSRMSGARGYLKSYLSRPSGSGEGTCKKGYFDVTK